MRKFLSLFFLFLFLLNIILFLPAAPNSQTHTASEEDIHTAAFPDPNTLWFVLGTPNYNLFPYEIPLKIFNGTGNFGGWRNGNLANQYKFTNFYNTTDNVTAIQVFSGGNQICSFMKTVNMPMQLALINRMLLNLSLYIKNPHATIHFTFTFSLILYFADSTSLTIGSLNQDIVGLYSTWTRVPFSNPLAGVNFSTTLSFWNNKYLSSMVVYCIATNYVSGASLKVKLDYELYTTKPTIIPKPFNIVVTEPIKWEIGTDLRFYADIVGLSTNLVDGQLSLTIINPESNPITLDMTYMYTRTNGAQVYWVLVDGATYFTLVGIYMYQVFAYLNVWGLYYASDAINTFELFPIGEAFPRDTYLSLFSSLDGLPLAGTDYKIYVGEDEETSLVNFKTFSGDWVAYGGSVNATYIDDYMLMETDGSGLKTEFEWLTPTARKIISRYDYNTLIFELKPLTSFWLVIRLNTPKEYDYYYNVTQNMVGYWWKVVIPFFNFTKYLDIFHGEVFEIGFATVGYGKLLLGNIRASKYYTPVWHLENTSVCLGETHFDVLGHTKTNIVIESNQTLQLDPVPFWEYASANTGWYTSYHPTIVINNYAATQALDTTYWRVTGAWFSGICYASLFCNITLPFLPNQINLSIRYISANKASTGDGSSVLVYPANISVYNFGTSTFDCMHTTNVDGTFTLIVALNSSYFDSLNHVIVQAFSGVWYSAFYTQHSYDLKWDYLAAVITNKYNYTEGWYQSSVYDLGNALQYYAYNMTYAHSAINDSTDITLAYRTSTDNLTWGAWSTPITVNMTLNAYLTRYFQFRVAMKAYTDHLIKECYWVNLTYLLDNKTLLGYTTNSYRLISPQNRQIPTNIQFKTWYQTIAILDYYNNTIYRELWFWESFIDIGLPIGELFIYNEADNMSIIAQLERGFGVCVQIVVPPLTMVSIRYFASNYRLIIRNLDMQILIIDTISTNRSKMVTYTYHVNKTLTPPPPTDLTWVYILIAVAVGLIALNIATTILQATHNRKKTEKIGLTFEGAEYG